MPCSDINASKTTQAIKIAGGAVRTAEDLEKKRCISGEEGRVTNAEYQRLARQT
jgi:hypothetical protein